MKVWIDGRIVDGADARLPVTDHGLLYGDGVFEGIRMRHGRLLWLHRHLQRLDRGARALGLTLPMPLEQIGDVVRDTFRAFGQPDAYVRLLLTRGEGPLGVDPTSCPEARIVCIAASISLYSEAQRRDGLALVTASNRRPAPDVLDPSIKSLNYLGSVLAKQQAIQAGADDALMLNGRGLVAEASVANLFVVEGDTLRTPPVTDGCLPGITRRNILQLANTLGLTAQEVSLGRADLLTADEVFLSGSGAGVIGVRSLDGRQIGSGLAGPVTARVGEALINLFLSDGEQVVGPGARDLRSSAPPSERAADA